MALSQEQILRVEQKLQLLIKQQQQLKQEQVRLQKENARLAEALQTATEERDYWQQQADTLKLNGNKMDEQAKKSLETRIDRYLKDIDKCLAMLHA